MVASNEATASVGVCLYLHSATRRTYIYSPNRNSDRICGRSKAARPNRPTNEPTKLLKKLKGLQSWGALNLFSQAAVGGDQKVGPEAASLTHHQSCLAEHVMYSLCYVSCMQIVVVGVLVFTVALLYAAQEVL